MTAKDRQITKNFPFLSGLGVGVGVRDGQGSEKRDLVYT